MKTLIKVLILTGKLLGCFVALAGAVWGAYWLCGFIPQETNYDLLYLLSIYTLNYIIPALLAFGYSLLVYVVLKNRTKRVLTALLNGVVMMGLTLGAFLLFSMDLIMYMPVAPTICIFSLILAVIMLALRPKSLPQPAAAVESIEGQNETA